MRHHVVSFEAVSGIIPGCDGQLFTAKTVLVVDASGRVVSLMGRQEFVRVMLMGYDVVIKLVLLFLRVVLLQLNP